MNKHYFKFLFISLILLPTAWAEEVKIHTSERSTPWGVTVEKYSYYLKKGKQIQHGDELSYYDDGNLFSKVTYLHGEPHGLATYYYYKRVKQKSSESTYINGEQHGLERQWSAEGELLFECDWKNGDPWNGRAASKSSSGTGTIESSESWTTYLYKNGKKVSGSEKIFTSVYRHQTPNQKPGMNAFIRWNWHSYRINSKYPYIEQLPPYEKIPFLIEWCANRGDNANVAHSQLVALTRVDFGKMRSAKKKKLEAEILSWEQWWKNTGSKRLDLRKTHGKRDTTAWKLIAGKRDIKTPIAAIVIPEEYEIQFTYSSGDYGGVISETITLKRTKTKASLVRSFSTLRDGPITTQTWHPFSTQEADRVTRAIGYLIDHPWLLNDEKAINRRFWEKQQNPNKKTVSDVSVLTGKIKGRESYHVYYAGSTFTLKDQAENVWWNDDPWTWHGSNENRYNDADQPFMSTVYPFIVSLYPEKKLSTRDDPRGWKNDK